MAVPVFALSFGILQKTSRIAWLSWQNDQRKASTERSLSWEAINYSDINHIFWNPSIYFIVNKRSLFFLVLSQGILINLKYCITFRTTSLLQWCAVVNHLLHSQFGGTPLVGCGLQLTQYIHRHIHLWRQYSHFVAWGRAIVNRENCLTWLKLHCKTWQSLFL